MSKATFNEKFDKLSSCNYYVGVTRTKDVRLFNYAVSKNNPNMVGITSCVDYIEIENSVDFSFRIGKVGIKDYTDLRKSNILLGHEILYIEYDNMKNGPNTNIFRKYGFFRVIGMEESVDADDHDPSAKQQSRYLTLTIAEFPYVDILTFNKFNKTYAWDGGSIVTPPVGVKPLSALVSDFFTSPTNHININQMGISYFGFPTSDISPFDMINYYSPNWSILKNINFLKRFATSLLGNHSYYYLNCEGSKINFTSIYASFLSPLNLANKVEFVNFELASQMPYFDITPSDASNVLMDATFKLSNYTDAMFGGLSGETKFTFDFLSGHSFNSYDYRLFKQLTTSNDLFYIYYDKMGNQTSNMTYSPFTHPKLNENLKRYEYSKKSFNSMVCEAVTFVNSGRQLGQAANIVLGNASKAANDLIDPVTGQNWCIWGYKDIISAQRGICKVTLKKDSTYVPYFGLGGAMLPGV